MKRISVADIIPGEFNLAGFIKQAETWPSPKETQRERERVTAGIYQVFNTLIFLWFPLINVGEKHFL